MYLDCSFYCYLFIHQDPWTSNFIELVHDDTLEYELWNNLLYTIILIENKNIQQCK